MCLGIFISSQLKRRCYAKYEDISDNRMKNPTVCGITRIARRIIAGHSLCRTTRRKYHGFSDRVTRKTIAGKGALARADLSAYGSRPLIVTGKFTARSPAAALLAARVPGAVIFDGITGEPTDRMIEAGVEAYRANGCDHVIGIGGGSALDSAKAIAAMSVLDGSIADYMFVKYFSLL